MTLTVSDVLDLRHLARGDVSQLLLSAHIGVSTDTRTIRKGDVFFAIRGEKFDGHRFVEKAIDSGAVLVVVDEPGCVQLLPGTPYIVVRDTVRTLGELSKRYRQKFSIPFIGVAGSNGKTMTKDMIAVVLGTKYAVLKTEGNLNNHIGVPQTLFRLSREHRMAVIELGTNHFGELAYLCDLVQPTHGLVTTIGHEHLEFFKDLSGVAKEEGALFRALGRDGTAFVNADDERILGRARGMKRRVTYGFGKSARSVRGTYIALDARACGTFEVKPRGMKAFSISLSTPGKHLMQNALAATSVGLTFNVPVGMIKKSLGAFLPSDKRMNVVFVAGVTIIDDTYNANPESMLSALDTLKAFSGHGKRIAVLADMLELGSRARAEHRRVGRTVADAADYLLTYGPEARGLHDEARMEAKFHYEQKNMLCEYLVALCAPGDVVLVKGSRGMKMEDVVAFLTERLRGRRTDSALAG
jgi:UDP-N-acetylmuramoyl-tripeptide--D-alanyl-D-alanine ligase